jgi:hypothetical protein
MEYFVEHPLHVVTVHQFRVTLPDTLEARTKLWDELADASDEAKHQPGQYRDTEEERQELAKLFADEVIVSGERRSGWWGAKGEEIGFKVRPVSAEDVLDADDWECAWKIIDKPDERLNSPKKWQAIEVNWGA